MKNNQIFPTILMILDVGAGIVEICEGNWRKVIYWFAAAAITAAVTY
jgi:hypothetical protein